jgi:hypothetical protein
MTKPKLKPMKQWRHEEAIREGVTDCAIANRLRRGKYPNLKIKRVNARVVYVEEGK